MTVTVDRTVEEFTATPRKLFISGEWVDAASGKTFETLNPSTGDPLCGVAEGRLRTSIVPFAPRKAFEGPWGRSRPRSAAESSGGSGT